MRVLKRVYEDYFKKSRFPAYRELLSFAKNHGYKMMGILDFYYYTKDANFNHNNQLVLINRHDIDTSPRTARLFFEIEKEVFGKEGKATYYFRDTTIDSHLISEIEAYGYETGYHYEQVATIEKREKTKTQRGMKTNLHFAQDLFLKDLERYRKKTGTKSLSVASHGDFINTKYDYQSYELLRDNETRTKSGIVVEAYDESIVKYVNVKHADQVLLGRFACEVKNSIEKQEKVILMLTHPRNWKVNIIGNTKENLKRLFEGIAYHF